MINLKVGEQTYIIKFGYKALAKSGILPTVVNLQKEMSEIAKAQEKRQKERENRKNFPEYNTDEMGNPIEEDDDVEDAIDNVLIYERMMETIAPLMLAGLQKKHPEFEVDYDNAEDVKVKTDLVIDLIDDYADDDDSMDISDLFSALTDELFNNGFLSQKSKKLEEAMEQTDSTITPTDHLQPKN